MLQIYIEFSYLTRLITILFPWTPSTETSSERFEIVFLYKYLFLFVCWEGKLHFKPSHSYLILFSSVTFKWYKSLLTHTAHACNGAENCTHAWCFVYLIWFAVRTSCKWFLRWRKFETNYMPFPIPCHQHGATNEDWCWLNEKDKIYKIEWEVSFLSPTRHYVTVSVDCEIRTHISFSFLHILHEI